MLERPPCYAGGILIALFIRLVVLLVPSLDVLTAGQDLEVKDANGRYRHARRAPVNETTLQPMRRVSKAGLESSSYS